MNRKRILVEVTQEHPLFVIITVIWRCMEFLHLLMNVACLNDLVSTGVVASFRILIDAYLKGFIRMFINIKTG